MEGNRNTEPLISIGRIVKPHGIRGEAAVEILTDFPERFFEMKELLLAKEDANAPVIKAGVESARFHKKMVLLKLDIINSPEEVDAHRNYYLKIEKKELYTLPPDEFYIFELVGMEVDTLQGQYVGKLTKVFPAGFHDIYEVIHPQTGKVNLIPAIKEFITKVDKEKGRMSVNAIEGLLEF